MTAVFISFIFMLNLFAQVEEQVKKVNPNKFTVCSITINSSEEREVFRKQIAKQPNNFNPIIELTEFQGDDWFEKACQSKVKCDQLIISGHFGGSFFGSSKKYLSSKILESKGCSNTCEGILSNPYEVFLFGCNTLAGKEGDHRTPNQYYQVLRDDGIPEREARMIVEYRYGAVGSDFKSLMQRAFGGETKQLYGFSSVGPSGKNVKGFLENYFSKINPKTHLEKLQAKRLMNKVDLTNDILAQSLRTTAFTQCGANQPSMDDATKITCKILDETLPLDERISNISQALTNENYLLFIPSINEFIKNHPYENLSDKQRFELKSISNNEQIKSQIKELIEKTNDLSMLIEWSEFATNLGISKSTDKLSNIINSLLEKEIEIDDKDLICSISDKTKDQIKISSASISKSSMTPLKLEAIGCLNPKDWNTQVATYNAAQSANIDRDKIISVFKNLALKGSLHSETEKVILQYLESDKATSVDKLFWFGVFTISPPKDRSSQKIISSFLKDDNLSYGTKLDIIESLRGISSDDEELQLKILDHKQAYGTARKAIEVVSSTYPTSKKVQLKLASFLKDQDLYVIEEAISGLTKINPNDNEVLKEMAKIFDNHGVDGVHAHLLKYFLQNPTNDEEIQLKIASKIKSNGYYSNGDRAKEYFLKYPPENPKVQVELVKGIIEDHSTRIWIEDVFKKIKIVSPEVQTILLLPGVSWNLKWTLPLYEISPSTLTSDTIKFLKKKSRDSMTSNEDRERIKSLLEKIN